VDQRPRLLIVDDEPAVLSVARRFAEAQHFDVIAHAGGPGLLAELSSLKPDAALLDRNMPELGGLDILRAIREVDPGARVAILTAMGQQQIVIEAIKSGAKDFVVKPFERERVLAAVAKLVA